VTNLQNHLEVVLPAGDYRDDATLTGQVRTWAEHDAVVDAAWMATGVYDVRDDLYVTG
jgi:osmotically-inducible protein OsmY